MKKVSIITPVYNRENVIVRCIRSVQSQTYPDIEHIIVDGQSKDRTLLRISEYEAPGQKVISEPDDGLYDAINKGISLASGDIIGVLNSDDLFASTDAVSRIVAEFEGNLDINGIFSDVEYFAGHKPDKVRRRYRSRPVSRSNLARGLMPAHPTLYLSRDIYENAGNYKTDYKIAADFEFIARAYVMNLLSIKKIEEVLVRMEDGGVSNSGLRSKMIINSEILRACRKNGIATSHWRLLSRFPTKLIENIRIFMRS